MNTLKLIFSGITTFLIGMFAMATSIDQPFSEKQSECIVSAFAESDLKTVEITVGSWGAITYSGKLSNESTNKLKLCSLYEKAHKDMVSQFIMNERWEQVMIFIYAIAWLGILGFTFWGEVPVNKRGSTKKTWKSTKRSKKTD